MDKDIGRSCLQCFMTQAASDFKLCMHPNMHVDKAGRPLYAVVAATGREPRDVCNVFAWHIMVTKIYD